jgi:hypothetical protein
MAREISIERCVDDVNVYRDVEAAWPSAVVSLTTGVWRAGRDWKMSLVRRSVVGRGATHLPDRRRCDPVPDLSRSSVGVRRRCERRRRHGRARVNKLGTPSGDFARDVAIDVHPPERSSSASWVPDQRRRRGLGEDRNPGGVTHVDLRAARQHAEERRLLSAPCPRYRGS